MRDAQGGERREVRRLVVSGPQPESVSQRREDDAVNAVEANGIRRRRECAVRGLWLDRSVELGLEQVFSPKVTGSILTPSYETEDDDYGGRFDSAPC